MPTLDQGAALRLLGDDFGVVLGVSTMRDAFVKFGDLLDVCDMPMIEVRSLLYRMLDMISSDILRYWYRSVESPRSGVIMSG